MALTESYQVNIFSQTASAAKFTVDTTDGVEAVPLTINGGELLRGDGLYKFKKGDGFAILSLGFKMPLSKKDCFISESDEERIENRDCVDEEIDIFN